MVIITVTKYCLMKILFVTYLYHTMISNVFLTEGYGKKNIYISCVPGNIYKNIYGSVGCNKKQTNKQKRRQAKYLLTIE